MLHQAIVGEEEREDVPQCIVEVVGMARTRGGVLPVRNDQSFSHVTIIRELPCCGVVEDEEEG